MNSPRRAMTAANGYSPLWPADWAKVTQRRIMIISDAAESRMLTALAQIGVVRSHFGPAKIFGGRSDRATMQNRTLGAHLVRRGWLGSDQFRYFVTMRRVGATVLVAPLAKSKTSASRQPDLRSDIHIIICLPLSGNYSVSISNWMSRPEVAIRKIAHAMLL